MASMQPENGNNTKRRNRKKAVDGRTRAQRRIRQLTHGYMATLGVDATPELRDQCRCLAELDVLAEEIRRQALAGSVALDAVVRVENMRERKRRQLGKPDWHRRSAMCHRSPRCSVGDAMATADFQCIFDGIIAERGRENLTVVHMAVVRALALALSSDPPVPATIGSLVALLPAPRKANEPTYDLRLLTDRELHTLEYLYDRAAGLKPAKPPRVRRTAREADALEAAQFIDGIARRDGKPTDAEMIQIRNYIHYLVRDVTYPGALYPESRSASAVALPTATAPTSPSSKAENVVTLTRPGQL
jgi:hypothetical protein